jgi:hypothetical protein
VGLWFNTEIKKISAHLSLSMAPSLERKGKRKKPNASIQDPNSIASTESPNAIETHSPQALVPSPKKRKTRVEVKTPLDELDQCQTPSPVNRITPSRSRGKKKSKHQSPPESPVPDVDTPGNPITP